MRATVTGGLHLNRPVVIIEPVGRQPWTIFADEADALALELIRKADAARALAALNVPRKKR